MTTTANQYRPDYAVPPGWVLEEELAARGFSQAEFARRCGRSAKLISEIVAGKAPIEPETAIQFDRVLGGGANIWLRLESNYRLRLAQQAEAVRAEEAAAWPKTFPVKELVARNSIANPSSPGDAVTKLLYFFGVGSVDAWRVKYGSANVAYRHSPSFVSDEPALATWLRLGEIAAESIECADYDETTFKQSLRRIRTLTQTDIVQVLPEAQSLCRQSGVVLAFVKPLPKTALSGAAWWLSSRKAVIQLSARHKTDDYLWFSFFHEAAHILLHNKRLHNKKEVFVDATGGKAANGPIGESEAEANAWAADFLVPRPEWEQFVASPPLTELAVRQFAERQGIAPGIVVGRLQHERHLAWDRLNHLKKRLEWKEPTAEPDA